MNNTDRKYEIPVRSDFYEDGEGPHVIVDGKTVYIVDRSSRTNQNTDRRTEWTYDASTRQDGAVRGISRMNRNCPKCDIEMKYVEEPLVSGFVGYVCTNENCQRNQ